MKNFDPFFERLAKEAKCPTRDREHYKAVMKAFFAVPVRLDMRVRDGLEMKEVREVGNTVFVFAKFSEN